MNALPILVLLTCSCLVAQGPNRCASTDAGGNPGNLGSYRPSLSADGRYCAFQSSAADLVPNDTNGAADIFVKDLLTGAIVCASVSSNGVLGNAQSSDPRITPDGLHVVFTSRANNFSVFDNNGTTDVYRHDLLTGQTVLVSCSGLGLVGNDGSGVASVSADGRFVAFRSLASNLVPSDGNGVADVFVKDLQTGAVELASNASPTVGGNLTAGSAVISDDGRYVAFDSYANNLVPGDTNATSDVFVRDRQTGTTHRISQGAGGHQANGPSNVLDISEDGLSVLFLSWASNLVPADTNNCVDQFVSDPIGANVERVTIGTGAQEADGNSMFGSLSSDGRFVVFSTYATNLTAGDTNQESDVLRRDRQTHTTVRASSSLGGGDPNGECQMPAIDDSGALVAYSTWAQNTLVAPMSGHEQIVIANLQPAQPATFTTFGQGCQGSVGVPTLDRDPATLPWTGTTLRLRGDHTPGNDLGVLAIGFSSTTWNGNPLPAPLSSYGMGACTLFTSVDMTLPFFTTGQGGWTLGLTIPTGASWLGVSLHAQAWLVDSWANALGAVMTNAATLGLGG
jgi:Tol biopolymer transport system component